MLPWKIGQEERLSVNAGKGDDTACKCKAMTGLSWAVFLSCLHEYLV